VLVDLVDQFELRIGEAHDAPQPVGPLPDRSDADHENDQRGDPM
jgi:hypothetical protein